MLIARAPTRPVLIAPTITKFIAARQISVLGIRTSPMRRRGHPRGPRIFSAFVHWIWSRYHSFPVVTPTKVPRYQMEARGREYQIAPPASIDRRRASEEQFHLPEEWGAASPKEERQLLAAVDDYRDRLF